MLAIFSCRRSTYWQMYLPSYWLLRWMKEVHPLFRHPAVLGVILVLYAFFVTFPADELSDQKEIPFTGF